MCGLAEGARDAFFLRKDLGDGGVDRQHEEIDFCTRQLSTIYELGSPDMIAEPPKHRTSLARIRLAKPAQLRALEKFLDPKSMGLPDTAYANLKLAEEARYGEEYGTSLLAKALAAYDRSDPGAARVMIVRRRVSDFAGSSEKLFAVMKDHLHAAGLMEPLRSGKPTPEKIWKAIQTLLTSMNETQELVAVRLGSKTRVVFTSSPGYPSMPPALQFVYVVLTLIAEGSGLRMLIGWADISHALRGFYELVDILIVLDEVLNLEV